MQLKEIIKSIGCEIIGDDAVEIKGLSHNSKDTRNGHLFFCLDGTRVDGHNFAFDAYKNGADAVVASRKLNLPKDVTQVIVEDTRKAMSECSGEFYGRPSKKLKIVAITGTNGKTTSSFMMAEILKASGKKVGVIGTNGIFINDKKFESDMTTPDPILLQKTFKDMVDAGVDVVVMEMSAHALQLQKNSGVMCDIVVFTNLTQDHLDYFKTMEKYGGAKKKLFNSKFARCAVLNAEDSFSNEIIKDIDIPFITVGLSSSADFYASMVKHNNFGQEYIYNTGANKLKIELNMEGQFNVLNSLGAIVACELLGVHYKDAVTGLKNLKQVPGRFNTYSVNGKKFVVDYAHTPDGLENILTATREILDKNGKLVSVFGCGGNRDKLKRPIMGEISTRLADVTIITSDNPRFENPVDIINDIACGANKDSIYLIEPDREKAIKLAYNISGLNDIVVVSGKGAENYIDINGQKKEYSDGEVIKELGGE